MAECRRGQAADLRVLRPHGMEYLFVICSRKFLEKINKESAHTLADVIQNVLQDATESCSLDREVSFI